jgi:hypothetical protein
MLASWVYIADGNSGILVKLQVTWKASTGRCTETALWIYLHWFNPIKNVWLSYRCGWLKPLFGTPLEILLFWIWIINFGQKWHGECLAHYLLQIHTSLHNLTVICYYSLRYFVYIYCISSIRIMAIDSKLKIAIGFFFLWHYSPNFGLGLPLWNSPFHFGLLDLKRLLGGWSARRKASTCTQTQKNAHTHIETLNIHALSGIRTHDPGFRASEDSACLRPLCYCDRPLRLDIRANFQNNELSLLTFRECSDKSVIHVTNIQRSPVNKNFPATSPSIYEISWVQEDDQMIGVVHWIRSQWSIRLLFSIQRSQIGLQEVGLSRLQWVKRSFVSTDLLVTGRTKG